MPAHAERGPANEIEHLSLAAIRSARQSIYIENQYLASNSINDALIERLGEPDGPEIVIVLPNSAESWIEQEVMDSARVNNLAKLRNADRHGRLAAYYPVNAVGEAIYVHAKVLVVDDRLVRIGSSNMSNRSMQLDSECDLAIEATAHGDDALSRSIAGLRNSLIAEHLGMSSDGFAVQLAMHRQNMVKAIEAIRARIPNPTLRPLPAEDLTDGEEAVARSDLLNPENPSAHGTRAVGFLTHLARRIRRGPERLATAIFTGAGKFAAHLRLPARPSRN
jgi:phospholipase D1/2